jgi:hypothetical protein
MLSRLCISAMLPVPIPVLHWMGFDHDEPSELICNRSIKDLAVAQQFHSSTGRSRASDNCVTRSPNERKVKRGHDHIADVGRARRNGRWERLCESG